MKFTLLLLALLALITLRPSAANLTVDGSQTYQTIDGYGVNVNTGWWNNGEVTPALDMLVDQLGATIFRAAIEEMDWEAVNDDADPGNFNWSYYNSVYSTPRFQGVWNTLSYLNQKGVVDGLVISFMGQPPPWMGVDSTVSAANEDEFVETMASLLYYARNTAGIGFTLVSPINEADTGGVEGPDMGSAQMAGILHKLAVRLDAIGMSDVRFVAPEAARDWTSFFNSIVADPVIMAKLACWGVHNYGSGAGSYQGTIGASAYPDKPLWVTETARFSNMLGQIPGNPTANLVWDGFDSVYQHAIRAGRGSTPPNDSPGIQAPLIAYNTTTHLYTPRKAFYEHAQLFRFVAPGAVRIGATGDDSGLTTFAYHHPATGRLTIVGRNASVGAIVVNGTLANLSPSVSALELYQTNSTLDLARGTDIAVSSGSFSLSIPAETYFTLTGFTGPTATITSPASNAAFNAPASIMINADANSGTGTITKVEFFEGTTKLGEDTSAPYSYAWSNVAAGTYALIAKATDSGGEVGTSPAVNATVAGPLTSAAVQPAVVSLAPNGTQQFTVTGTDAAGRLLNPQPPWVWSTNGGGTINSSGLFTAGSAAGGPFTVTASSGPVSAVASVSVASVDSTIGGTGEGTFTDNIWDNGDYINACRFQAPTNMNVTFMRAKVTAIAGEYQCAIYSDNAGNANQLLRATAELSNPADGWHDLPLTSPLSLTSGNYYWLAIWSNAPSARVYATNGGTIRWGEYSYGAWPNPINLTGGGSATYSLYAVAPALTAIEAWRQQYFGTTANTGDAADLADPNLNGLVNLLEYALGTDPTVASTSSPFAAALDGGNLTLTYPRSKAATDITVLAEVSGDLVLWSSAAADVDQQWEIADDVLQQTITARDKTLSPPATNRFMRLNVTRP